MHGYTLERCDAYALGTVDVEERTLVDEHLGSCGSCSRAVGEAERVVCVLIEMTTPLVEAPARLQERIESIVAKPAVLRPRRPFAIWGALAAAAILSLGVSTTHLWQDNVSLRAMSMRNDALLATITTSHFLHVSLTPRSPGVPAAKVLYTANGSWLYLVVDAPSCNCHLIARYPDGVRDLGAAVSNDVTSTLFVKSDGRPRSVHLESASGAALADGELK